MGARCHECGTNMFLVIVGIIHILVGLMGLASFLATDVVMEQTGTGKTTIVRDEAGSPVTYNATMDLVVVMDLTAFNLDADMMGLPPNAIYNETVDSDVVTYSVAEKQICKGRRANETDENDCRAMKSYADSIAFYVASAYISSFGALGLGAYLVLLGIVSHCCGVKKRKRKRKQSEADGYEYEPDKFYQRSCLIRWSEYTMVLIDLVLFGLFFLGIIIYVVPKLQGTRFKRVLRDVTNESSLGQVGEWDIEWDPLEIGMASLLMSVSSVLAFIVFMILWLWRCQVCIGLCCKTCKLCCKYQKQACCKACDGCTKCCQWWLTKPCTLVAQYMGTGCQACFTYMGMGMGFMGQGCAVGCTYIGQGFALTGVGITAGCAFLGTGCGQCGALINKCCNLIVPGIGKIGQFLAKLCQWVAKILKVIGKAMEIILKPCTRCIAFYMEAEEKSKGVKKNKKGQKAQKNKKLKKAKKVKDKKDKADEKKEEILGEDEDKEEDKKEDKKEKKKKKKKKDEKKDDEKEIEMVVAGAAKSDDDETEDGTESGRKADLVALDSDSDFSPAAATGQETDTETDLGGGAETPAPTGSPDMLSVGSDSDFSPE